MNWNEDHKYLFTNIYKKLVIWKNVFDNLEIQKEQILPRFQNLYVFRWKGRVKNI